MCCTVTTVAIVALFAGCTTSFSSLNDGLAVGDCAASPDRAAEHGHLAQTLRADFGAPRTAPGAASGSQAVPPPTTLSIDRGNWAVTRINAPSDLAGHQPIYTRSVLENTEVARNRGSYPTPTSANQISHRTSEDAQLLEAAIAPVAAAADIVLFIPRAIMNPPWETVSTGLEPYRRSPLPSASVSPVVAGSRPNPSRLGRVGAGLGIVDPAAAPVQVPVGEFQPAQPQK